MKRKLVNRSCSGSGESNYRLRPMLMADLPAVRQLERACSPTPWPTLFFRRLLRRRTSCWVYEHHGEVVGYGVMQCMRGWAHIMNLCIAPTVRRRGLGKKMLIHLLREARRSGATRAWLEVHATNLLAVTLYKTLGFSIRYRRKGYYHTSPQRQRDALVMLGRLED